MNFPIIGSAPQGRIITPFHMESIGTILAANDFNMTSAGSAVWPSANLAMYVPFIVTEPAIALQMFTMNGATANGTIYVGIYTEDGTRLVTATATQTGTTQPQTFDIADTLLSTGTYYMALASTSGTGTFYRANPGANLTKCFCMLQQASAAPLPTLATFAAFAQNYVPVFGIAFRSTV